jgi:hypothetical protein
MVLVRLIIMLRNKKSRKSFPIPRALIIIHEIMQQIFNFGKSVELRRHTWLEKCLYALLEAEDSLWSPGFTK